MSITKCLLMMIGPSILLLIVQYGGKIAKSAASTKSENEDEESEDDSTADKKKKKGKKTKKDVSENQQGPKPPKNMAQIAATQDPNYQTLAGLNNDAVFGAGTGAGFEIWHYQNPSPGSRPGMAETHDPNYRTLAGMNYNSTMAMGRTLSEYESFLKSFWTTSISRRKGLQSMDRIISSLSPMSLPNHQMLIDNINYHMRYCDDSYVIDNFAFMNFYFSIMLMLKRSRRTFTRTLYETSSQDLALNFHTMLMAVSAPENMQQEAAQVYRNLDYYLVISTSQVTAVVNNLLESM